MMQGTSTSATDSDRDRLTLELNEAREQLDATNEILAAIGRSASDVDAVLGAVVESARRLCKTDAAIIHLLEGDTFRVAAAAGVSDTYLAYMADHPIMADRASMAGRVTLDRKAQQIPDVLTDPGYGRPDVQRVAGFRTLLGVPMLIEDEVIGVLLMWRNEIGPFTDHAIDLVTTFAAQAAIAIRNADLVHALQTRSSELADKIDQLEALHEIGHAVSSSLDLDEVLAKIVSHAVQLTDTDGGSLLELDLVAREFRIRAAYGTSPALLEALHRTHIALDSTLVGRACLEAQPQMVYDLETAELDPHLGQLKEDGWRSALAVPMQHEGTIVGALVVRRRSPGDFSDDISGLLQTFASQSALAIVNARLFRELEQKSRELQVASRHKSEFLASMSHELRTPLNAVIGFSEVLLQRMFGDINERQEDYLRDILSSGRHLLELLNDILDLSKVEAGRMQFDRSRFLVLTALESCLAQVRESAHTRSITLSLTVGPDVGEIDTDELRFKQVVLNLLSNAVKFTTEGGAVDVRASLDGDGLRVTVSDNGIGIALEDRERIFDSFEQAGRARNQNEGTGLGLTLSRRIVERLGGRMWLESEVGIGSTFSFVIPLGDRPAANSSGVAETAPVVVIVEDDHHSIELLSLYLESAGVRPVVTHDGALGLAAVRRLNPSAVILDIRLPGMDGWGVLRELKADPLTASVPVVVITMLDERPQAMSLGASEYLIKPVGREAVIDALGRVGALPSETGSDAVASQGDR